MEPHVARWEASRGSHDVSHEQLWAPWRLEYLEVASRDAAEDVGTMAFLPGADPACFLCRGAVDPANPVRYVIHHDELVLTVLNRYPYNNGHLLVAPRRHCARLDALTPDEQTRLVQTIARMIGALEKVLRPEGFNVGLNLGHAAGAGVPGHLHWHIVPRWSGAPNFMPTLACVKVIPQSLDALRDALAAVVRSEA